MLGEYLLMFGCQLLEIQAKVGGLGMTVHVNIKWYN